MSGVAELKEEALFDRFPSSKCLSRKAVKVTSTVYSRLLLFPPASAAAQVRVYCRPICPAISALDAPYRSQTRPVPVPGSLQQLHCGEMCCGERQSAAHLGRMRRACGEEL
jgi:hypothetical protein